ncbi:hypothetical protein [Massilia yuzhufengensis]|uniref:Uncharacterized protein n=1 Tax=Massilia yuzhufengensis TaxID=1164594 RepID=A0A1I1D420_9BURK|nr:hypothetical protein [Massilia yuzhufengensis]SFB69769.1 hypothetical protein SAMN05216204_10116 [Massilia yuzhufengensis]
MTTYRGFASMPSPLLWIMAAFFVIPGVYDAMTGMFQDPLEDVMLGTTQLLAGAFLLYCAVQSWRDKRLAIASPRTTLVGYACFGLFCLCFVVKVGASAMRIFA